MKKLAGSWCCSRVVELHRFCTQSCWTHCCGHRYCDTARLWGAVRKPRVAEWCLLAYIICGQSVSGLLNWELNLASSTLGTLKTREKGLFVKMLRVKRSRRSAACQQSSFSLASNEECRSSQHLSRRIVPTHPPSIYFILCFKNEVMMKKDDLIVEPRLGGIRGFY